MQAQSRRLLLPMDRSQRNLDLPPRAEASEAPQRTRLDGSFPVDMAVGSLLAVPAIIIA